MSTGSRPQVADALLDGIWRAARLRVGGIDFVSGRPEEVAEALARAAAAPDRTVGEHVHLLDAWSIASSASDPDLAAVYADPRGWALPQGRPIIWPSALRRGAAARLRQVRAPQLLAEVADRGRAADVRHWLLGGDEQVLTQARRRLEQRFPGIRIVGTSPQIGQRAMLHEIDQRDAAIEASGAQVVWIALGTPAEDFEAARLAAALPVVAVTAGDALEQLAGRRRAVPAVVCASGFEWLWRFAEDPRGRWRRAVVGNLRFMGEVGRDEFRRRRPERTLRALPQAPTVVVGQLPPPLHGSAVMTQRLVEALVGLGRPVAVVDRRFSRSIAEVGSVGIRKLLAVPSLLLRFLRAVAGGGTVVVLITTRPATFLLDVLLLRLARRPAVLYVHTVGFRELADRGPVWRRLVVGELGRASRVVVLGASLADDVAPFVEAGRLTVIPNCTTAIEPYSRPSGARLLFLSNLLPGKGADAFVRLASRLREERPEVDWRFDLAGAGDPSGLPTLPEGTVLHGRVEGLRKDELLKAADVLVLPSTYAMEAQPLVIVEAMSYGLPVVAYDNGGIRDLVDSSTGALVPRGDEDALLRAVSELIDAPDRLEQIRGIARRRHRERHSLAAYAEGWRTALALHEDVRAKGPVPEFEPAATRPAALSESPLTGSEPTW